MSTGRIESLAGTYVHGPSERLAGTYVHGPGERLAGSNAWPERMSTGRSAQNDLRRKKRHGRIVGWEMAIEEGSS
jgi:hypothetical protein